MDELVEFLHKRLDEEQRAAEDATPGPWSARPDGFRSGVWMRSPRPVAPYGMGEELTPGESWYQIPTVVSEAVHIARQHPQATIDRVAAVKVVVDLHRLVAAYGYAGSAVGCRSCDTDEVGQVQPSPWRGEYCPTLRVLGTAYRSHPEYRAEWSPLDVSVTG